MRFVSRMRVALSLIEVLTLLSALLVLIGILLPAIQQSRVAAAQAMCQNNLKQLAQAAQSYYSVREKYPAGEASLQPRLGQWSEESYTCWILPLLPYLGEVDRAEQFSRIEDFQLRHRGGPHSIYGSKMPFLICPIDDLPASGQFEYHSPMVGSPTYHPNYPDGRYDAVCSYGANWGTESLVEANTKSQFKKNGIFHYNTSTRNEDIVDGASTTILFGERSHHEPRWQYMGFPQPVQRDFSIYSRWYTGGFFTGRQPHDRINYKLPAWLETDPPRRDSPIWNDLFSKRLGSYGSEHPNGCNMVMADGSIRFVSDQISITTLQALATKSGNEKLFAE